MTGFEISTICLPLAGLVVAVILEIKRDRKERQQWRSLLSRLAQ